MSADIPRIHFERKKMFSRRLLGGCILVLWVLLLTYRFTGCGTQITGHISGGRPMPARTIEEVQNAYTDAWMDIPGVVGTAVGEADGKPCIRIFVLEITEELEEKLPFSVEGFPVIVEVPGGFRTRE